MVTFCDQFKRGWIAGLFSTFPPSNDMKDDSNHMHTSVLLQIICIEYIDAFHDLNKHPSKGQSLTITKKIPKKVNHATPTSIDKLYPQRKVKNSVDYIVQLLGGQGRKVSKRDPKFAPNSSKNLKLKGA